MKTKDEELQKKISAALNLMKEKHDLTQEDIAAKLSERGYRISSSELSRAKIDSKSEKLGLPKLKKISAELDKFIADDFGYVYNFEQNIYSKKRQSTETKLKLKEYYNTKWWFYSYLHAQSIGNHKDVISKAILHISENGNVELQNINMENSTDYVGILELLENQVNIVFHLRTKHTHEKNLIINVFIGEGRVYPIATGLYQNIDLKGAVVGGTVIMELIPSNLPAEQLFTDYYELGSEKCKTQLNPLVRQFLASKTQNYIKVTTGLVTYDNIHDFLKKNEIRRKTYVHEGDYDYDIFISSPMKSLDDQHYTSLRNDIINMIDKLKSACQFDQIYYAGMNLDSQEKFYLPWVTFRVNMAALERSKYIVLIYPEKVVSSVLIEIGWAVKSSKPCLLFVKNRKDLPHIMQQGGEIDDYTNIRILEYTDNSHILKIIENNGRKLFGEF